MDDLTQRLWFGIASVLTLGGCTFEDGEGFATLESATFSARFEPGSADTGDGAILTSQGYRVTLTRLALGAGALRLLEPHGGEATEGEACQEGHCHGVEVEPAADGAHLDPVVTLPIERTLEVLEQPNLALDRFVPSRELPQANVSRLSLGVETLAITGTVSGAALGTATSELVIDLHLDAELDAGFLLTIDRDEPGAFSLAAQLTLDATLFDAVDFAAHVAGARIELTDAEAPPAMAIGAALRASKLSASIR